MARQRPLSSTEIFWWTTLGVGSGLVAGFMLSEWVGGVNRRRVKRHVRRLAEQLRQPAPAQFTPAATARAVEVALRAEPRLSELTLQAIPSGRGIVELRGWVPTRAARALASRLALTLPGVDRIINSILVHGEDDFGLAETDDTTDQSA